MKKLTIFLLFMLMSVSCYYPGRHMMDWGGHMDYGYGGVIMWLILLVVIVVIVFFIVSGKKYVKHDEGEAPLDILKKRYAKGEISKKEFESMKKDLE